MRKGPKWRAARIQVVGLLLMTGLLGVAETAGADQGAAPNPMIHAEGTRLVDGTGTPIKLRGVLLEGWLMWGGPMWGAGLTSETTIMDRIVKLVGEEEAARFRLALYDQFISERDIEMIADLGLNVVRVPFNHTVLEKNGAIDETAPGWFYLDRLLDWCEKHGVYVVLDLHAVPRGQSIVFVADPEPQLVWGSEADLQRTVDLWEAIASRYHARTIVAGYDLINEPEPPKAHELVDLYRRIIQAIRAVDPHHLIFLTGTALSTDFGFYEGPLDDNQAYTFHTYDFFTHNLDESQVTELARLAEEHDVPLWNGEFGAHTDRWTAGQIALFEDPDHHVNGWIYWPWKRVSEDDWRRERFAHLMGIESTEAWDTVRKHLGSLFGRKKIPRELASQALTDFLEASQAENLIAEKKMVAAVRSWKSSDATAEDPIDHNGILHEDLIFEHQDTIRTYHFYEAPVDDHGARPLVFLLHGGGAVIDNHIGLGPVRWPHQLWLDIARRDSVHLVVPQGIGSQWNDCRSDCRHCGEQDDVGFLIALLDDLAARFEVDLTRVYSVGESNGGIMTLRLAQETPERFAGMGVVIAGMPENNECRPASDTPISIMFQLGTDDEAVPYDGGRSSNPPSGSFQSAEATLAFWVEHNRCDPIPTRTQVPDGGHADRSAARREDWACPGTGTAVSAYHLEGAGHVPPSLEIQVSALWEQVVGRQNHDVETSTAFWSFLADKRRDQE